jgi:hypothetical protein
VGIEHISLKNNAMEASDAIDSFARNHAGVSDQVPYRSTLRCGLDTYRRSHAVLIHMVSPAPNAVA